ncbi:carbon-nitrogen hydrolase family protein [Nocardioides sp. BP30]|uniref:carbon-nitrogen hydrolase family protein n=1 Tax=Nocardioides sp. BP30 TaxID=3036374 RepID=UPI002468998A|nr:carbon-nitrogen hydrolase family protein [Nocardioides sp. BP30]WGL52427.1 carbon-nitrogen hydrolase family protein [Nocardioides sp. BP30]
MTWTTLDVALVQEPAGLEPDANRARIDALTPGGVDLVVFPEVFARDFGSPGTPLGAYAEGLDGPFATEVERVARDRGTTIVAGMLEQVPDEAGTPFNTLVVRGHVEAAYRKIHLYDSFGYRESDVLAAGPVAPRVITLPADRAAAADGARIGLMTCYDLRFPELARALVDQGAEILVVPAAWVAGDRKVDHWRTLLRARAIENTVFVVACGQPAPRYCGHSMVIDPLGDVLAEAGPDPSVITATLSREVLAQARRVNPSLANRRL